jgi:hypothetical protein
MQQVLRISTTATVSESALQLTNFGGQTLEQGARSLILDEVPEYGGTRHLALEVGVLNTGLNKMMTFSD